MTMEIEHPGHAPLAAYERLIELGLALSSERSFDRLLERFVLGAKEITNADGATIYILEEKDPTGVKKGEAGHNTARREQVLAFKIIRNDTLGIAMGGTTGKEISFYPVPLERDGKPNFHNVSAYAAISKRTINIEDAYHVENFDFSGTKGFDSKTGYRSKSFLTVPMLNHKGDVIGVIQLINAREDDGKTVVPFSKTIVPLIEALASQAAVAIDNQQLIEGQRLLFDAFMHMMAAAVDAKSAYTGGHCQRVPVLTEMLAHAACDQTEGLFADFALTEEEWYELKIAGGLHDVGKVTTPVHIMDKATKLEKIVDRIHDVGTRVEILKRDAEIAALRRMLAEPDQRAEIEVALAAELKRHDDDYTFLQDCNVGGEFMADEKIARMQTIGRQPITIANTERTLLTEDEMMNLAIRRGTLNDEDRKIINDHIVLTIQMLESLPFPKHLKRVPEIAGGHHEKMDGTGYPRKLKRHEMSWLARMMGIADIFEALTAADRPYKKPKTLSESIKIMSFMKKDQHIDADLFDLFLRTGLHKEYAERFLMPEQIDEVDITPYLTKPVAQAAE
ncbi:MAG: HD domain-containing phosphohydrolase [Alphaproteobacteria bacterium]|nr:HD domain-containing phosphohydrolase [Alphaproteobacteria bacterium]